MPPRSSHRGVKVHTGDAAASSFKGLVGLQAPWGDQEKGQEVKSLISRNRGAWTVSGKMNLS